MSRKLAQLLCVGVLGGLLGPSVAWAQNPSVPGFPGATTTHPLGPGIPGAYTNPSLPTDPSNPGAGTGAPQYPQACLYGMDARGNCLPSPNSSLSTQSTNQLPTGPAVGTGGSSNLYTQPNPYTTPGTAGTFGTTTVAPGTYSTPGTVVPDARTLTPRNITPDVGTPGVTPGTVPGTGAPLMGPGSTASPGPALNSPGANPTLTPTGPTIPR